MSYESPNKAEIREIIHTRLMQYIVKSGKDPKKMTVLCFPGEDCRELWIYQKAGIPMENIYAFEKDLKSFNKIQSAKWGVNLKRVDFLDKTAPLDHGIPRCDVISLDLLYGPKKIHDAISRAMYMMKDDCFVVTNCADDGRAYMDKELQIKVRNIAQNLFPKNMAHYNIKSHVIYLQTTTWLKNFFNIEDEICYQYAGTKNEDSEYTTPMKGIIANLIRKRASNIKRTAEEVFKYDKKITDKVFKFVSEIKEDMMHQSNLEQGSGVFNNA